MGALPQSSFAAGIAALAMDDAASAIPLLRRALLSGDGGELATLNLGMALANQGHFAEAQLYLQQAAQALPDLPEPGVRLGVVAATRGDTETAAAHFLAVLQRHPRHVPALAALAALQEGQGHMESAAALVERARQVEPEELELALLAGRLALARGKVVEATELAEQVLTHRSAHVPAAQLLARALLVGSTPDAALALVAHRSAAAPFSTAWALVKAFLYGQLGINDQAVAELQAAAAIAPDEPDIQAELGRQLARQDRAEEALATLLPVVAAKPGNLELLNLVASLLWKRHHYAAMVELLETALAKFGAHPTLNMNLALVLNAQGRQAEALMAAEASVAQAPGGIGPLVNRIAILPYHEHRGTAAELSTAAAAIAAALPTAPCLPRPRATQKPRLRLGLLSGGLGVHPVGWLTLAGLEALPENQFEIFAYSLKSRKDSLNQRFRARSAQWREVAEYDDATLAGLIRADGIDILLDMGGYGDSGRPFVLTHRPASVQVKWVGSQFGTTGLPGVDYMLTDQWETPPGFEPFYSEALLRLPDGYVCYAPPAYAPAVATLPALSNGHLTFGCFNNLAKITPAVWHCWAKLLQRLPESRLILRTHALSDPGTLALTEARIRDAGLPRARMELHGGCPHQQMLASYGSIDIALDPFPYTGGLTVCESLWMGVPVVALAGDSFAGRHALSHLSNVGLADWVTTDADAYVALACKAAADLPALQALRGRLREQVRASPLCDATRFGANLDNALKAAWNQACQRDLQY